MPAYEIKAVKDGPDILLIAAADSAQSALTKYRDAFGKYRRVWVTDERGEDVTFAELSGRATTDARS